MLPSGPLLAVGREGGRAVASVRQKGRRDVRCLPEGGAEGGVGAVPFTDGERGAAGRPRAVLWPAVGTPHTWRAPWVISWASAREAPASRGNASRGRDPAPALALPPAKGRRPSPSPGRTPVRRALPGPERRGAGGGATAPARAPAPRGAVHGGFRSLRSGRRAGRAGLQAAESSPLCSRGTREGAGAGSGHLGPAGLSATHGVVVEACSVTSAHFQEARAPRTPRRGGGPSRVVHGTRQQRAGRGWLRPGPPGCWLCFA